jgi:hypothetical protein
LSLNLGATQIGSVPYLAISHTNIEIPMEWSEQAQYLAEIYVLWFHPILICIGRMYNLARGARLLLEVP